MQANSILIPIFPLFALTLFVMVRLFLLRVEAVKSGAVSIGFYRVFKNGVEPDKALAYSRHLTNLLELPPLFYISCILIFVTDTNSVFVLICAWVFVIARYLHAYIHLGGNNVRHRFRAFGLGVAALSLIWIASFIAIIQL